MVYSTHLYLLLASLTVPERQSEVAGSPQEQADLPEILQDAAAKLLELAEQLRQEPVSPVRSHQFETQLQEQLRELGRQISQHTYNHLEPKDPNDLAKHLRFDSVFYTRLNRKTPQNVWTLFGQIRLWRTGYRPTHKGGEPTFFPLANALGLLHGASPALAECASRLLAAAGSSQRQVLQRLKADHGVGWGVVKLREVTQAVSERLAQHSRAKQIEQVLAWLKQASEGTGRHKPVLAVGRDGITLPLRHKDKRIFEVASTATVSVLDRRGKRRGTVYLAYTPESCQPTMSRELTELLEGVLAGWTGPLPRLCYVSDAGDNETGYYEQVLRGFKHPSSGKQVEWIRVLDYYHASQRVWKLGELLFGKGRAAWSWSRKMQRWLLKPGGANRVLHSAAAHQALRPLCGKLLEEYFTAYDYLSSRIQFMRYADYKRQGIPRGSGITEAGCKTVYTQRLKLSGMNWEKPGAQTILNLRIVLLSGIWEPTFQASLNDFSQPTILGSCPEPQDPIPFSP